MPELPEVETMRRGVEPIVGGRVTAVEKPRCRLKPISVQPGWRQLRQKLVGQHIARIDRRGKRLIIVAVNELRLVIEPRMTGLVALDEVPNKEHLRLRLALEDAQAPQLLFWDRRGLGTVRLLTPEQFELQLGPHRIGPDALECTPAEFRAQFETSRRAIKVALLDQKAIAGVGNLYASEMLYRARIAPQTPCNEITVPQWRKLHTAMQKILAAAIQYEGSTLSDGTYRNALNESGGYQKHHRVYDREGEPCGRCKFPIARIVQAQRSTFFCPNCQAE